MVNVAGVLKGRCRVIGDTSGMMEQGIELNTKIIVAAIVLNNRALMEDVPIVYDREEQEEIAANAAREAERERIDREEEARLNNILNADNPDGLIVRERLIASYFNYARD